MGTERLSGLLKITQLANSVVSDSESAQRTASGETHDYHALYVPWSAKCP